MGSRLGLWGKGRNEPGPDRRLGSYGRGVLVLIPAPESHPRGKRGGGQGEGAAGARQGEAHEGRVHVRGEARHKGKDCNDTVGV